MNRTVKLRNAEFIRGRPKIDLAPLTSNGRFKVGRGGGGLSCPRGWQWTLRKNALK